jgi:hypothetical protein
MASTGALGLAACLGSVDRAYSDGGAGTETGSTTDDDATADVQAEAARGMDGGMAQEPDATMIGETGSAETSLPPADARVDVGTGQTFDCNGTTVTSCANCPSKPIECVFCAGGGQGGGGHPGVCGAQGSACSSSTPKGAMVCTCPGGVGGNVSLCPAPFQVCTYVGTIGGMYYCQTCGEMGSNMETCKGGGHCSDVTGMCN